MLKIKKDQAINILNVGTKILLKDVMDQYLRSLGEVKTYYASKLSMAVESAVEKKPQIIFCERFFPDGGALDFIHAIGGLSRSADQYFVLATEEPSDELVALAVEMNVDEILVKPFSIDNIHQIVERYLEKKAGLNAEWCQDLRKAREADQAKRFQEAEELYAGFAEKHSSNIGILVEASEFFCGRRNYAMSAQIAERALKISPSNVPALNVLGLCYKKSGKFREALDYFSRAQALSPLNNLRNLEVADVHFQLADEQVSLAQKGDDENSNLIMLKAKIMYLRKEYSAAVTYMDAKRPYLSEMGKKEADNLSAICKKFGGLK